MLGHKPYFYDLTRKYVSYFGTVFNDLYVQRDNDLLKVPLTYAPKKKILLRYTQDPGIDKPAAIVLPRMAFEIAGDMTYDSSRTLSMLNRHSYKNTTDADKMKYVHTATPINIPFNLYIYTQNTRDGLQILEQILPVFKPEWTASLQLIPSLGITRDVPIIRTGGPVIEDSYDGSFKERQILTYTLSFVMKAWYFGPTYDKPIIKFSIANFYLGENVEGQDKIGTIQVTPGMDANGAATSNSSITVSPSEIFVDDDFGYVVDVSGILLTEN